MGYDLSRFPSDVNRCLLCPICRKVLEDPVQIDCVRRVLPSSCDEDDDEEEDQPILPAMTGASAKHQAAVVSAMSNKRSPKRTRNGSHDLTTSGCNSSSPSSSSPRHPPPLSVPSITSLADLTADEIQRLHVFCRSCIVDYFAETSGSQCPIDDQKFKRNTKRSLIQRPSKLILDALSRLLIRCDFKECSSVIPLPDLGMHIESCPFKIPNVLKISLSSLRSQHPQQHPYATAIDPHQVYHQQQMHELQQQQQHHHYGQSVTQSYPMYEHLMMRQQQLYGQHSSDPYQQSSSQSQQAQSGYLSESQSQSASGPPYSYASQYYGQGNSTQLAVQSPAAPMFDSTYDSSNHQAYATAGSSSRSSSSTSRKSKKTTSKVAATAAAPSNPIPDRQEDEKLLRIDKRYQEKLEAIRNHFALRLDHVARQAEEQNNNNWIRMQQELELLKRSVAANSASRDDESSSRSKKLKTEPHKLRTSSRIHPPADTEPIPSGSSDLDAKIQEQVKALAAAQKKELAIMIKNEMAKHSRNVTPATAGVMDESEATDVDEEVAAGDASRGSKRKRSGVRSKKETVSESELRVKLNDCLSMIQRAQQEVSVLRSQIELMEQSRKSAPLHQPQQQSAAKELSVSSTGRKRLKKDAADPPTDSTPTPAAVVTDDHTSSKVDLKKKKQQQKEQPVKSDPEPEKPVQVKAGKKSAVTMKRQKKSQRVSELSDAVLPDPVVSQQEKQESDVMKRQRGRPPVVATPVAATLKSKPKKTISSASALVNIDNTNILTGKRRPAFIQPPAAAAAAASRSRLTPCSMPAQKAAAAALTKAKARGKTPAPLSGDQQLVEKKKPGRKKKLPERSVEKVEAVVEERDAKAEDSKVEVSDAVTESKAVKSAEKKSTAPAVGKVKMTKQQRLEEQKVMRIMMREKRKAAALEKKSAKKFSKSLTKKDKDDAPAKSSKIDVKLKKKDKVTSGKGRGRPKRAAVPAVTDKKNVVPEDETTEDVPDPVAKSDKTADDEAAKSEKVDLKQPQAGDRTKDGKLGENSDKELKEGKISGLPDKRSELTAAKVEAGEKKENEAAESISKETEKDKPEVLIPVKVSAKDPLIAKDKIESLKPSEGSNSPSTPVVKTDSSIMQVKTGKQEVSKLPAVPVNKTREPEAKTDAVAKASSSDHNKDHSRATPLAKSGSDSKGKEQNESRAKGSSASASLRGGSDILRAAMDAIDDPLAEAAATTSTSATITPLPPVATIAGKQFFASFPLSLPFTLPVTLPVFGTRTQPVSKPVPTTKSSMSEPTKTVATASSSGKAIDAAKSDPTPLVESKETSIAKTASSAPAASETAVTTASKASAPAAGDKESGDKVKATPKPSSVDEGSETSVTPPSVSPLKVTPESAFESGAADKTDESVLAAVISSGGDSNSGESSLPFRKRRTPAISSPSVAKSKKQEDETLDTTSSSSESIINQILQIEDEKETKNNEETTQDPASKTRQQQPEAQQEPESHPESSPRQDSTSDEQEKQISKTENILSESTKVVITDDKGQPGVLISAPKDTEKKSEREAEKELSAEPAADDSALKAAQLLFTSLSSSSSSKSSSTSQETTSETPVPTTVTESEIKKPEEAMTESEEQSKLNGHPESEGRETKGPDVDAGRESKQNDALTEKDCISDCGKGVIDDHAPSSVTETSPSLLST